MVDNSLVPPRLMRRRRRERVALHSRRGGLVSVHWTPSAQRLDDLCTQTILELRMTRLTEKLKTAREVSRRVTASVEARADALIAREAEMMDKTDRAFSPHEAILDEAHRELDAVENELKLMSNDPLPGSGNGGDNG